MKAKPKKKVVRGEVQSGALYVVAVLGIVATFGAVMAGGAIPTLNTMKTPPKQPNLYTCCDSGDGAACHPILEKQITYNGQQYALLKSNIAQQESQHIIYTDTFTSEGNRIYLNQSDTTANYSGRIPGCEHGKDLVGIHDPSDPKKKCVGIPNDELIYVCKASAEECGKVVNNGQTAFDVYYRLSDGPVPAELTTFCPKPSGELSQTPQHVVGVPTPQGAPKLQLDTFSVKNDQKLFDWLGAWCKPAINLYPTEKTQVHVEVAPKGKFTYTNPLYPENGWDVTAYPDGKVTYKDSTYPYLYWEASLPDSLITQPKQGYVAEYKDLKNLFSTIMPQLGLNEKESSEFSSYWLKALPQSPYYFVGVMPESEIDNLAPLTISPKPDSLLRVSLYFKALDNNETVAAPNLSGFQRNGFTVTEWGGFFKADKNHKDFTCVM